MDMSILNKKYHILSVIGSHAGEDVSFIFSRKQAELRDKKRTYWMIKSFKASTLQIQNICKQAAQECEAVNCLFINAAGKNGARPTTHNSGVKHTSKDGKSWDELPEGFTITGKIDAQSTALVLDELQLADPVLEIDLWKYSEFENHKPKPLILQLGASTICCEQIPSEGMKSRFRSIVAWGRLTYPYAVFVK
jgi:hypothetical protein